MLSFFVSEDGTLVKSCSYKKNIAAVFKAGLRWKEPQCRRILAFLPMLRETRKNIQYLTDHEIQILRETAEREKLSMRNKTIIYLLIFTGLRGCDIAGLTFNSLTGKRRQSSSASRKQMFRWNFRFLRLSAMQSMIILQKKGRIATTATCSYQRRVRFRHWPASALGA